MTTAGSFDFAQNDRQEQRQQQQQIPFGDDKQERQRQKTKARTEADPYGMTNKRGSKRNDNSNGNSEIQGSALKAGWGLGGYVEGAFEGETDAGYGAFVEEAAYEGDAVGDAVG